MLCFKMEIKLGVYGNGGISLNYSTWPDMAADKNGPLQLDTLLTSSRCFRGEFRHLFELPFLLVFPYCTVLIACPLRFPSPGHVHGTFS